MNFNKGIKIFYVMDFGADRNMPSKSSCAKDLLDKQQKSVKKH